MCDDFNRHFTLLSLLLIATLLAQISSFSLIKIELSSHFKSLDLRPMRSRSLSLSHTLSLSLSPGYLPHLSPFSFLRCSSVAYGRLASLPLFKCVCWEGASSRVLLLLLPLPVSKDICLSVVGFLFLSLVAIVSHHWFPQRLITNFGGRGPSIGVRDNQGTTTEPCWVVIARDLWVRVAGRRVGAYSVDLGRCTE